MSDEADHWLADLAAEPYGERAKWTAKDALAGVPQSTMLWHMDQLQYMLGCNEEELATICFREGVDSGTSLSKHLRIINISPDRDKPMWRCDHKEFIRYCKRMKIPIYPTTINHTN